MRTRCFCIAALAAVVTVLAAGCGGGDGRARRPAPPAPAPPAETGWAESPAPPRAPATERGGRSGAEAEGGILRHRDDRLHRLAQPVQLHRVRSRRTRMIMIYPQLVQYDLRRRGRVPHRRRLGRVVGDLRRRHGLDVHTSSRARSGRTAQPMTADDAAWTINTTLKYADGPTAVAGIGTRPRRRAPRPSTTTTLVIHYDAPVGNALEQLEHFFVLPAPRLGAVRASDGQRRSRRFKPEQNLPMVTGRRLHDQAVREEGDDGLHPRPELLGRAVERRGGCAHYYTNSDSMVADLQAGQPRLGRPGAVQCGRRPQGGPRTSASTRCPGAETTNITWNSNPRKPKNRELLDPQVKKALSMCVDRERIIEVVFNGYARPRREPRRATSRRLENPNLGPLEYDCDAGNQMLDELGYARGSDGIRVAPATTGEYAAARAPDEVRDHHADVAPTSTSTARSRSSRRASRSWASRSRRTSAATRRRRTRSRRPTTCDAANPPATRASTSPCGTGSATSTRTSCSRSSPRASGARGATPAGTTPSTTRSTRRRAAPSTREAREQIVYEMQQMIYDDVPLHAAHEPRSTWTRTRRSGTGDRDPNLNAYSKMYCTSSGHGRVAARRRRDGAEGPASVQVERLHREADPRSRSVTVFVAVTLNFVLFRAVPGDAVVGAALPAVHGSVQGVPAAAARARQVASEQYRLYLGDLLHGDLGSSLRTEQPVTERALGADQEHAADDRARHALRDRASASPDGVVAAWRRGTPADKAGLWTVARLLLDAAAVARPDDRPLRRRRARASDLRDRGPDARHPRRRLDLGRRGRPARAHAAARADARPRPLRRVRADHPLGDARDPRRGLRPDGAGEGASNWAIVWRHGLRNALLPIMTLIALSLGFIIGGSITIEYVFSYPGIGLATVEAIDQRDYAAAAGDLPAPHAVGDPLQPARRPPLLQARPAGGGLREPRRPRAFDEHVRAARPREARFLRPSSSASSPHWRSSACAILARRSSCHRGARAR